MSRCRHTAPTLLLLLLPLLACSGESTGVGPEPEYDLAFLRGPENGDSRRLDLYVTALEGEPLSVTGASGFAGAFSWAPDGRRLALLCRLDGLEICVVDALQKNVRMLTNSVAATGRPRWSPDGSEIAFRSDRDGGRILLIRPDGTGMRTVATKVPMGTGFDWSPSGRQIAFVRTVGVNDRDVYRVDADGTRMVRLTDDFRREWDVDWSPDGKRIAFSSQHISDWQIRVLGLDGGGVRTLTDSTLDRPRAPVWSPDGSRLAFIALRPGDRLHTIRLDGSELVQLTHEEEWSEHHASPSWSPDGTRIAYVRYRAGALHESELYIVAADGSSDRRLTHNSMEDLLPMWRPRRR